MLYTLLHWLQSVPLSTMEQRAAENKQVIRDRIERVRAQIQANKGVH